MFFLLAIIRLDSKRDYRMEVWLNADRRMFILESYWTIAPHICRNDAMYADADRFLRERALTIEDCGSSREFLMPEEILEAFCDCTINRGCWINDAFSSAHNQA